MLLVLAATEIEMSSYMSSKAHDDGRIIIALCGVGPVEAAVRTMEILCKHKGRIKYVLNFGIGGAYIDSDGNSTANLLDICLADREVLGDYGVIVGDSVEPFSNPKLFSKAVFQIDDPINGIVEEELRARKINVITGGFVTVNGASGTESRGRFLQISHDAICENMEGAAIARCCDQFSIPMVEIRSISNMVEDRPGTAWLFEEACARAGQAAAIASMRIVKKL